MTDTLELELAEQAKQDHRKAALAAYIEHHGIPPVIDGPQVEHFNALELAYAIEHELAKATTMNWKKIELRMDLLDAFLLAQYLRGISQ